MTTIEGSYTVTYASTVSDTQAAEAKSSLGKGGGWLLAIALALGKIADGMGERMLDKAKEIDTLQQKQAKEDDQSLTSDSGKGLSELNAELQVLGQQLGQMLQMMATIVKTIGEGNKDLARKQ